MLALMTRKCSVSAFNEKKIIVYMGYINGIVLEGLDGEQRYRTTLSLTSALDWVDG